MAAPLPVAVAAMLAAGVLGGCTSTPSTASTESPTTLLQQVASELDAAKTFRLTVDTLVPKSSPTATTAPKPGPSTPAQTEAVKMSGVWDVTSGLSRMDGTVNAVKTTILSAAGVEYVSLTSDIAAVEGRKWLKVDDSNATFGEFGQPGLVAQVLRAFHEVHAVSTGHLAGTIVTGEADEHIADPNLLGWLGQLPDELRFDVWTDGSGAPSAIQFTLTGAGTVTTGTARLDSFGTAPVQVNVPTINEVVQAPAA
ncbi:MAG TPA: hypothetical protein VGS97_27015 [Actinocrinis sp.]|uniref:hypothetical protein n=1 Tax=Actinocrinis sp. TaxID=1920516 RepID=UPI002DDCDCA7|nr:hypothetical protein [Actinocrinis sp.]HEV2347770.1 hypothetical protein [Actinocrinis sp.]